VKATGFSGANRGGLRIEHWKVMVTLSKAGVGKVEGKKRRAKGNMGLELKGDQAQKELCSFNGQVFFLCSELVSQIAAGRGGRDEANVPGEMWSWPGSRTAQKKGFPGLHFLSSLWVANS
jgi:hypothetical protein